MAWVMEKRSIVLLHGVVSSQLTWWRLKLDLEDLGWQVHAVDMLGHGSRHAAGPDELTIDDLAQDVLAQIPGPVNVLAGHSLESTAASLHMSTNTARSHLKSLFHKTQTSRQTELLSFLSRLG